MALQSLLHFPGSYPDCCSLLGRTCPTYLTFGKQNSYLRPSPSKTKNWTCSSKNTWAQGPAWFQTKMIVLPQEGGVGHSLTDRLTGWKQHWMDNNTTNHPSWLLNLHSIYRSSASLYDQLGKGKESWVHILWNAYLRAIISRLLGFLSMRNAQTIERILA